MNLDSAPVIDVWFGLSAGTGATVPADYGYALYSALSRTLPWLHAHAAVAIHPLRGRSAGERRLLLTEPARLGFRLPADLLPGLLPLAGTIVTIDGARLRVGTPNIAMLQPTDHLVSRLVVIKGGLEPQVFLQQAEAQLAALGVTGDLRLLRRRSSHPVDGGAGGRGEWVRRTLRIQDQTVVGYAVAVGGLAPDGSVRLQTAGLGGRRRFGCGVFVPAPGARQ
ncbi:MAG: type I-MYXAN CRISPR-associated protein Cas6/Cmx6 [Chloroflexi bacterium]|nr:type I-MYXAN CRISPR-associated protein Cas6/Cmx6 [Chloroflexota bacterium]